MRRFEISDADTFVAAIQDEIARTPEGRYFHRLHVILYVLQGNSTYEAARIYAHSPRTIQYWIHRLLSHGLAGLRDSFATTRICGMAPSYPTILENSMG